MPTTSNFGWTTPADTDLVKDGAAAIRTLGNGIDTSFLDLKGGTTGQVLSKASNTDLDFSWVAQDDSNAIQNAIVDAKGDLITATAADTPAILAVGTNGHILTADSTTATGLKWAAPAGGGKVLQVVSTTTTTQTLIQSTTYTDSTVTATITPTLSTSKILVIASVATMTYRSSERAGAAAARLMRGATAIQTWSSSQDMFLWVYQLDTSGTATSISTVSSITYLDAPATTSATTYKVQGKLNTTADAAELYFQFGSGPSTITLLEIGA